MHDHPTPSAAHAPVAEFERRTSWRAMAMLAFLSILLALAVLAVYTRAAAPPILTGLPADPDMRAAAAVMLGRYRVDAGDLRFQSTLLGPNEEGSLYGAGDEPNLNRVATLIARARSRHPRDPRLLAAAASVDLVRRRYSAAERGYRAALDRGSRYGEGRLGLGLALALRAESESDPLEQRRLLLRSIAQFASIDAADPAFAAGLYDRALLLDRVGRHDEARRVAGVYITREESGRWAERLRSIGVAASAVP